MAVNRLKTCSDEFIENFLPLLVHNIQYEDTVVSTSPLANFLLDRAIPNPTLRVNLFFLLSTWSETPSTVASHMYDAVRQQLLIRTALHTPNRPDNAQALVALTTFVTLCETFPPPTGHSNDTATNARRQHVIEQMEKLLAGVPLPCIIDPSKTLKSFDLSRAKVGESATKPLIIPYISEGQNGEQFVRITSLITSFKRKQTQTQTPTPCVVWLDDVQERRCEARLYYLEYDSIGAIVSR